MDEGSEKAMKEIRILALTRYGRLGASSRLRTYQYLPFLKKQEIDVEVIPLLDDEYIKDLYSGKGRQKVKIFDAYLHRIKYLFKARCFDLVWIEKELFPFLPAWGEATLNALRVPYIVEYDDAIYHNYDLNPNRLVRFCFRTKIDQVMKRAEVVVVGNDYLGDRARQAGGKRIEYIPTAVDLERYKVIPKTSEAPFTIGWVGSPSTARYIQLVQPALSEICKDGQTRVVLVGSGPVKLADVPVEILSWTEESEVAAIQDFDVGIMPLPDEPWERGKCGYKLIQYLACGRPVIASPVGVNQQIVEHGVNGFLAREIADWISAMRELRDNAPLREAMGRNGRSKVKKKYSIQVTAPRLAEILLSVAERTK
jgi:glycosyltransferase involved in cell wall biosynthesis